LTRKNTTNNIIYLKKEIYASNYQSGHLIDSSRVLYGEPTIDEPYRKYEQEYMQNYPSNTRQQYAGQNNEMYRNREGIIKWIPIEVPEYETLPGRPGYPGPPGLPGLKERTK